MVEVILGQDQARNLLDRVGVLRHPCDLDLLLFLVRHPHTLMATEQLACMTGYGLQQTTESLDRLLKAELLTRTQNPTHAARMYVFTARTNDGWLLPLLEFASTRHGRVALRRGLAPSAAGHTDGLNAPAASDASLAQGARPFLVRRRTDTARKPSDERRRGRP
jgi:hypothetical protein